MLNFAVYLAYFVGCIFFLTVSLLVRYHLISYNRKPLISQSILPNNIIINDVFLFVARLKRDPPRVVSK